MNNTEFSPVTIYQTRLDVRKSHAQTLWLRYKKIGWARIFLLACGVAIIFLALTQRLPFLYWGLLPLGLLSLWLIGVHQNIYRQFRTAGRAVQFYERGLARLTGDWYGKGTAGDEFNAENHLYAQDIDLFGKGSLFELLCGARTRAGEQILAAWLSAPAAPAEILARQAAIRDLQPKIDFREDLFLRGDDLRNDTQPASLIAWSQNSPLQNLQFLRWITGILCAATIITLLLVLLGFGGVPLFFVLLINAAVGIWIRPQINAIIRGVEGKTKDLQLIAQVMARIETEPFAASRLTALRASLTTDGQSPARQIGHLHQLLAWLDVRLNQLFRPLSAPFFLVSQLALAVEAWRVKAGIHVAEWLFAVGEIEALLSLAGYSFEHPNDVMPEIVDGGKIFAAEALGHPLLPENKVVRTEVKLDNACQLLVVSGSNMSGKSTFLRSVAMNAVLALAGAPVRAQRLQVAPLQLGASIRIQDNLRAGASLFYAEITRLRQLMETTNQPLPVLFVIDEILHGTNSHDRRIGAAAVLRGLVERGAFGLVTTHDLALTNIVEELQPRARNVHFEDHLANGRMTFDYILRDGIVQKSNALELMRSVGLEV